MYLVFVHVISANIDNEKLWKGKSNWKEMNRKKKSFEGEKKNI